MPDSPPPGPIPAAPAPESATVRPPGTGPTPRVGRREAGGAALLAALLATLFLSPALFTGRIFSPADVIYAHSPWHDAPPAGWSAPSNDLVGEDSAFVFEPWLIYSAQRLQQGALPLWNPDNLLGVPLIGNMQSAVFSPLNWPFFLWPDPHALVLPAWLKLWLTALGTYLLAREVAGCRPLAAAVAMVTFACGAFMSIWLLYPLSSAITWLPWLWWAAARLLAAPGRRIFAGFAALVALNLLAGHPESAFHIAQATGVFALFYIWQNGPPGLRRRAGRLGLVLAAYGLGALLAAVQLLPFLDYLGQSVILHTRAVWQSPVFPFRDAWALFSPELFGSPTHQTWWDTGSSYNEITNYCGVLPLLLAPFAFMTRERARRRFALFLLGLGAVSLGVVYRWPVVFDVVMALPFMQSVANQRLLVLVQFALALLAALGADALLAAPRPTGERRRLAVLAASSLGLLLVGVIVPWVLVDRYFAVPADPPWAHAVWQDGVVRTAGLLAANSLLLAAAIAWRRARPRLTGILSGLLLAGLVADLTLAYGGYNTTISPADYFPPTAATQFLQARQATQGPLRIVALQRALPPNANLVYGLADPRNYDALEPELFHELAIGIEPAIRIKPGGSPTVYRSVRSPLINLLNVAYVLAAPDEDPNYEIDIRQETGSGPALAVLRPGDALGQTFVAGQDNLAAIQVRGSTAGGQARGTVVFHLKTDPAAAADLATVSLDLAGLPDQGYWWVRFPPIPQARGRSFYFYAQAAGGGTAPAPGLFYSPAEAYAPGTRMVGGQPAAGDLLFRVLAWPDPDHPWFTRVLDGGPARTSIFANRRALPRAWLAHQVEVQPDPGARLARLSDPNFAAADTALLAAPLPPGAPLPAVPPPPAADRVTITGYAPEQVTITTASPAAGLLVLADQAFSGWEAALDGAPAPILTADHTLRAVYVPAGSHTVGFAYRPPAFAWGAAISGAALLGLIVLAGVPTRRRARRANG